MGYEPKRAIVTGSDSGIGRATAVALAAAGMDVGVTWHSDEAGAYETADLVPQLSLTGQPLRMHVRTCSDHEIRVRATDREGNVQTGAVADVLPDGATGWHEVEITVQR